MTCIDRFNFFSVAPQLIFSPLVTLQIISPETISLNCSFEGLPVPDLSWIKVLSDGSSTEFNMASTMVNGRTFHISDSTVSNTVTSIFTISPTTAIDTATYICMATNRIDSMNSTSSDVSVYGKFIQHTL